MAQVDSCAYPVILGLQARYRPTGAGHGIGFVVWCDTRRDRTLHFFAAGPLLLNIRRNALRLLCPTSP